MIVNRAQGESVSAWGRSFPDPVEPVESKSRINESRKVLQWNPEKRLRH
jgi:hypothetical protein